jgi:hypothetical protein
VELKKEDIIASQVSHEKKKELLAATEISLVLDSYDDIFSDFDPRHFHERSLSEDFLLETKRASIDKGSGIELRFLIPKTQRNLAHEALIKQRLREHFRKHHMKVNQDLQKIKRKGVGMAVIGIVIGVGAVWINLSPIQEAIKLSLEIVLQPASWFNIWEGFAKILFLPPQLTADEEFYRKMTSSHITFLSY